MANAAIALTMTARPNSKSSISNETGPVRRWSKNCTVKRDCNKTEAMRKRVPGLVVSFILLAVSPSAPKLPQKTATLVEANALPGCAGLDCPPWPMPIDVDVCIEMDGNYYTGMYRPWGVPWAKAGKRLLELKGQSVEVIVTDSDIRVVAPKVNARLQRMHNYRVFRLDSCNAA
jgi:hypothetical protein